MKEEKLTAFIVENQVRFYRLAYSYLKNREEALDAVQTAVCRALEKQDGLQDADALRTWFYRILVNVCMDQLRCRKRVTLVPPEALDTGSYEDPLPSDGTLAQRVDALPAEVGTIVKLRFYEELSLKEISAVTGVPLSTVKTRLYTGLKKLRVTLESEERPKRRMSRSPFRKNWKNGSRPVSGRAERHGAAQSGSGAGNGPSAR